MNYNISLFCEFDKYAEQSYCAIHDVDKTLNIGDITLANEKQVSDFNTMFGGSPCQDFSVAGKLGGASWLCKKCGYSYNPLEAHYDTRHMCPICRSTEIEKTRSSLLVEWLRFLREKKPRFAIYENVKNITGKKFKHTFDLFLKELNDYGYNVYWQVLNAKDYGIPQNRERVYCVIIRKDLDNGKFKFPEKMPLKCTLQDKLEDFVDDKYYLSPDKVQDLLRFAPPLQRLAEQLGQVDEAALTDTVGTSFKKGIKVQNQATVFDDFTNIAGTLMARDYKGFGNQTMTAILEH